MKLFLFAAFLLCLCKPSGARIKLPALVRDSMVLQRDARIKIWGWASPGEKITVQFAGKRYHTNAGSNGKWLVAVSPLKAGGPYTMSISGRDSHLTLKEILMGDVWLCAGQSNMVHTMFLHRERYEEDIQKASYPQIRYFWIPPSTALQGPP